MTSKTNILKDTRVYLSGPMDFVASRAAEQKYGWRNRVGEFLRKYHVTVFDPWFKPEVRGLYDYGREGIDTNSIREVWTYKKGKEGAEIRAKISGKFWETMHIDLRMVDTCDFVIAYCPTSIYSVGTPHEIVLARQQRKPVLFVSPPIVFPSLQQLREHLKSDSEGTRLLDRLVNDTAIKENPKGLPSLWYMPLVSGERFFDGFGFKDYIKKFGWDRIPLDDYEDQFPPQNPLLPFIEQINNGEKQPQKWDNRRKKFVRDDDWIIFDIKSADKGAALGDKLVRGGVTK